MRPDLDFPIHPNVQRKLKAAVAWCDRINALPAEHRNGLSWHYVLLAENVVDKWQSKDARLAELLNFARLRPPAEASLQQRLRSAITQRLKVRGPRNLNRHGAFEAVGSGQLPI